ncbi:Holliday junction resolvase RuvX [Halobacillus andaensis]|uniref:Holliday junction resolvase RuvX n=1 Tax=Halobacillus andaensis TaxID=1176239 RepID=UPI003D743D96
MKKLGLDVGEKTIGIAISDALGWTARGLTTLHWDENNYTTAKTPLHQIIDENEVSEAVIGLPRNMNGTIGPRAEASQRFGKWLEKEFRLRVQYWDERLTTMAAERVLLDADVSREKRKKVIDKMAAVIILQSYLDAQQ